MLLLFASISAAQPFAYVTNTGSQDVSVINIENNTVITTIPMVSRPFGVTVSPDSDFVYIIGDDDTLSVIRTTDNKVVGNFPLTGSSSLARVAVRPDGEFLYITGSQQNIVSVMRTRGSQLLIDFRVGPISGGLTG